MLSKIEINKLLIDLVKSSNYEKNIKLELLHHLKSEIKSYSNKEEIDMTKRKNLTIENSIINDDQNICDYNEYIKRYNFLVDDIDEIINQGYIFKFKRK